MAHELDRNLDLSALHREASLRVVYSFIEPGEYEPTLSLFPLSTAIDIGLAKTVQTPGENIYVVTPSEIGTTDGNLEVNVVSAQWRLQHREIEITTYDFDKCVSCGGPVVPENSEIRAETTPCQYCSRSNQSIGSKNTTLSEQELEIEEVSDQVAWEGTPDQMRHEHNTFRANQQTLFGRLINIFNPMGDLAPVEVIETGEAMVGPNEKITYTGPFQKSELLDLFVQIGELQPNDTTAKKESQAGSNDKLPTVPSSYVVEKVEINDRGDYLVIIEADSAKRLPLVVMVDPQGNPSRFAVPLYELMLKGWNLSLPNSEITLNDLIRTNGMDRPVGPTSTRSRDLGLVKVFEWDTDSVRHDKITDVLYDYGLSYDMKYVSADIPTGRVSFLFVEEAR